jgi:Bacterial PH domain
MRGSAPDGAGSSAGGIPAAGNDTGQGGPREPATSDDAREPAVGQPPASRPPASQPRLSPPQVGKQGAWRLTGPAGPVKATAADEPTTGKATPDGKILYRRLTSMVLWWAWLAFVVFCLVDVVIPAHSYLSVEVVAGLLTVTAFVYACAVRPRVIVDDESVLVYNPFRDHHLRWGAVRGVFLGDSIEFSCARPAPNKDKTIYCWALYTARRPRMRSQMQRSMFKIGRSASLVNEAADLQRKDIVQLMAVELGRRCKDARERGTPEAVLASQWAWLPLVSTLALAGATLALILLR